MDLIKFNCFFISDKSLLFIKNPLLSFKIESESCREFILLKTVVAEILPILYKIDLDAIRFCPENATCRIKYLIYLSFIINIFSESFYKIFF